MDNIVHVEYMSISCLECSNKETATYGDQHTNRCEQDTRVVRTYHVSRDHDVDRGLYIVAGTHVVLLVAPPLSGSRFPPFPLVHCSLGNMFGGVE